MNPFPKDKLDAIKTIAVQFAFNELTDNPGIFMNDKKIVINTFVRTGVAGYTGLPMIGMYDNKGMTDENNDSTVIEQVREAISAAFKALPKKPPRTQYDSKTGHGDAPKPEEQKHEPKTEAKKADQIPEKIQGVKHDESKTAKAEDVSQTNTKAPEPEQKKTVPVKMCRVCGFALEPARAMECFSKDPQEPVFICADCEEKPVQRQVEVMPPVQKRGNQPSRTMPVKTVGQKGLMIKNFMPRCAEIGGIRIGRKGETTTASGYRLPEKLDHFIVTTPNKDKSGNFIMDDVMSLLPENPTKLRIMLLYDDEKLNFSTQFREIRGGRIVCSGDGETAFDKESGQEIVCNIDTCPKYQNKKCKLNGILSVILLDKPTIGGVYRYRTTGWNSVQSIMTSMLMIKTMTRGLLAMIPLTLTVTPKLVTPKGADKAHTIYFVNIEYHGTDLLEKVIQVSQHRLAMQSEIMKLENQSLLLAPESEEELKDIQDEFYPGQV